MQPRSIRLNQDLRDEFIRTVIAEIMPDEKEPTIQKFQETYAQQAYDATYGLIASTMAQLPAWAIINAKGFFVKLGENDPLLFVISSGVDVFHDEGHNNYHSHYRYSPDHGSTVPELDDDHPITQTYEAQEHARIDWGVKRRELQNQLRELTNTCNTTGQLFKTWPKAMEFAHVFPQPEVKERKQWEPSMDAAELDLGVELSQVEIAPIKEN